MAKDPEDRYPTSYDLALAARSAITSSARMPLPPMPTTERRPRIPTPTPPPISSTGVRPNDGSAGRVYPPVGDDVYERPTAAGRSSHPGYAAPYPHTPPPMPYPARRWSLSTFRSWLWACAQWRNPTSVRHRRTASQRAQSRAVQEICDTGTRRDCRSHRRVGDHLAVLRRRLSGSDSQTPPLHRLPRRLRLHHAKPPAVFEGTFTAAFGPPTEFGGARKAGTTPRADVVDQTIVRRCRLRGHRLACRWPEQLGHPGVRPRRRTVAGRCRSHRAKLPQRPG